MNFLNSLKEQVSKTKTYISGKAIAASVFGSGMFLASSIQTFASADTLPTVAITQDMLKPLVDGVVANITVALPIGLALFSVFLGIRIVPALFSRFTHM